MADKHVMILSGQAESGAQEWACPDCGRRLLLQWRPQPERLVLAQGDPSAVHTGGAGGVRAGGVTAAAVPPPADRQWLRDHGIDWDGPPA